ncbi:MAG: hypothetical protein ACK58T_34935, partial [Phycisphaerae bacterium]
MRMEIRVGCLANAALRRDANAGGIAPTIASLPGGLHGCAVTQFCCRAGLRRLASRRQRIRSRLPRASLARRPVADVWLPDLGVRRRSSPSPAMPDPPSPSRSAATPARTTTSA